MRPFVSRATSGIIRCRSARLHAKVNQMRLCQRTNACASTSSLSSHYSFNNLHIHTNTNNPLALRCYGSKMKVELEQRHLPGTEKISSYLRSCVSRDNQRGLDMEFAVSFLGTGGGAPTMHRNGSCTALRLGGQTYLFDLSEGTMRQVKFTTIAAASITKIFVSHLHGDHLYGLVPAVLEIGVAHKGRNMAAMADPRRKRRKQWQCAPGEKPTLEIFGPPGLYNYLCMVLALSSSKMNYMNVTVVELVGGREELGPQHSRTRQRGRRNVFLSHYPEVEMPSISRKYLQPNKDNVWVIDEPERVTLQSAEDGVDSGNSDGFHRLPNDVNLGVERRLHIRAAELDHVSGVQTFGYTVEEQPPPGNIDVEKAQALGVKPSKKYGLLKCGIPVPTDDGLGEVRPEQVLIKSFRPRKFAFLADHRRVPVPMRGLCRNADLLVHEATLWKSDGVEKVKIRGHTSAYEGGVFAREMGCKVLALNHFGGGANPIAEDKLSEAQEGSQGACEVVSSFDFLEMWVPRGGYDFDGKGTET